jgi:prepilin peptidase CpaA
MGGGDAKLLFPVGLFLGWGGLLWFAVALIPASLLTLLGLWIGNRPRYAGHPLAARIAAIRSGRGVPYAVTLFFAVVLALALG